MDSPDTAPIATIAVVGLGAMGGRMAERLLAAYDVVVWNRTDAKTRPLVDAGARVATSPAAAAAQADAAITMVSDPTGLRNVTEGPGGVLAGLGPESTLIEMSTVGPAAVTRLASLLPPGAGLLDAPVLGSIAEADAGTLRIFVGGPSRSVDHCRPVLSRLGTPIRVGPLGSGAAAKLVANATLFGVLGLLGEALATRAASHCPWPARTRTSSSTRPATSMSISASPRLHGRGSWTPTTPAWAASTTRPSLATSSVCSTTTRQGTRSDDRLPRGPLGGGTWHAERSPWRLSCGGLWNQEACHVPEM
jgi:hypothetical protein